MVKKNKFILVILDGFGFRKDEYFNGILNAHMKNYFSLYNNYPHTKLHASGPLVGLPEGQIGSSEVGHMTIGAGKLIKQPIVRINEDIKNNLFQKNKNIQKSLNNLNKINSNLHILGLLSDGGVHSSIEHLFELLNFYDKNINKIQGQIYIHNFLDGRDTQQKSALKYLNLLQEKINSLKNSSKFIIATLCGRYYAMDRDNKYERTKKTYDLLVNKIGKKFTNYKLAINHQYSKNITDEFIEPIILNSKSITENDTILFYNFRSDRPKQIINSIVNKDFKQFKINKKLNKINIYTLTDYSIKTTKKINILYSTIYPKNTFGEIIAKNKLKQLRISESEKYPHVTYFFNGLKTKPFKNETNIKISSPKVKTYDLQPEMSIKQVTSKLLNEMGSNNYDFILLNFANPDMVGHTGNFKAVIQALKQVDNSLLQIKQMADKTNTTMLITADHGNCETMKDENNNPHTKHTYNLVPFILCDNKYKLNKNYQQNSLYNIAPTLLELMKIDNKYHMEKSLILK